MAKQMNIFCDSKFKFKKLIKKIMAIIYGLFCTVANGALTWFSLGHFFEKLHTRNNYIIHSFNFIHGFLTFSSSATTALTQGAEIIEHHTTDTTINSPSTNLTKKITSFFIYWGICWIGSWFILLSFFTAMSSILPNNEEEEPNFAFEEIFASLVAISIRHGFMIETAEKVKINLLELSAKKLLSACSINKIKTLLSALVTIIFSILQAVKIYFISHESLHLLSKILLNSQFTFFLLVERVITNHKKLLCCVAGIDIGLSTCFTCCRDVLNHMNSHTTITSSLARRFALCALYLDALIAAFENALIVADIALTDAKEDYQEFTAYLSILITFVVSFYGARCVNAAAEENITQLFIQCKKEKTPTDESTNLLSYPQRGQAP